MQTRVPERTRWRVLYGDCLELLADLQAHSIDAVVCDPPYGINFQGRRWDGQAIRESAATTTSRRHLSSGEAFQEWTRSWASECLRLLKPSGHLLAFGSPRTFHRLASGLEDAGFELRDTLMWVYASGMPKSRRLPGGQGTALKPAWEPIVLARKQPDETVEHNLRRHGVGALNIDACRIEERWPANVLLGHHHRCTPHACATDCALSAIDHADKRAHASSGSTPPSRLFFSSKVSRSERDAGCEQFPPRDLNLFPNAQRSSPAPQAARNPHPTVKPIALMRWLVRLACPPGGLVLDPFCGSGSTGAAAVIEGRRFLGIERETAYIEIARARISHWAPTTGRCAKEQAGDPLAPEARRAA
jgi:site-specific DNA-methyltransferase (adenine-specific)